MTQDGISSRLKYLKISAAIVLAVAIAGAGYSGYQGIQIAQRTSSANVTTRRETTTGRIGILVTWLGHASFRINTSNTTIYIDPYEGEYNEKADIILVTHSHADHCNTTKMSAIRKDSTLIIALIDCATKIGGSIKSLKPGEKTSNGNIAIEATEAYNFKRFRSPGNPCHPKGLGVGYLLTIGGKTIYHAGDTDFIPEMKDLKSIDLALLPTGGTYTMDNQEATEAILTIKPKYVIPMHRWNSDPNEVKSEVEAKSTIKVLALKPSEKFQLE